ncbi:hypothetical protein B0H10DRAFT_1957773 [Mycena sp. CBHHK59/15]|nr:hypothetical protein B0H10DRAFT_1957773 [Mycena sp. CBHHK59/15]
MSLAHPLQASPSSPQETFLKMKILSQGPVKLTTLVSGTTSSIANDGYENRARTALNAGQEWVLVHCIWILKQPEYQQDKFPEAILHHVHMRSTGLDIPRRRSISHQMESREINVFSKLSSEIEPLVPAISGSIRLDVILTGPDVSSTSYTCIAFCRPGVLWYRDLVISAHEVALWIGYTGPN